MKINEFEAASKAHLPKDKITMIDIRTPCEAASYQDPLTKTNPKFWKTN